MFTHGLFTTKHLHGVAFEQTGNFWNLTGPRMLHRVIIKVGFWAGLTLKLELRKNSQRENLSRDIGVFVVMATIRASELLVALSAFGRPCFNALLVVYFSAATALTHFLDYAVTDGTNEIVQG